MLTDVPCMFSQLNSSDVIYLSNVLTWRVVNHRNVVFPEKNCTHTVEDRALDILIYRKDPLDIFCYEDALLPGYPCL